MDDILSQTNLDELIKLEGKIYRLERELAYSKMNEIKLIKLLAAERDQHANIEIVLMKQIEKLKS